MRLWPQPRPVARSALVQEGQSGPLPLFILVEFLGWILVRLVLGRFEGGSHVCNIYVVKGSPEEAHTIQRVTYPGTLVLPLSFV